MPDGVTVDVGNEGLEPPRDPVMGFVMETRRNLPDEGPCSGKEKVVFSRASRSMKFQDKPNALKCEKTLKHSSPDHHTGGSLGSPYARNATQSFSSKTPANYNHKQRPYRDGTGVEELVKYMSNVPAYLQLLERGDSNQEKALNVGVLDWARLRKWRHNQRPTLSRRDIGSPSSCSASPSLSTLESSSQSCKSSATSGPATERNQSTSPRHHRSPYTVEDCKNTAGEKTSRQFVSFLSSEFAAANISVGSLQKIGELEGNNHFMQGFGKSKGKYSDSTLSGNALGAQEFNTSIAKARDCEISSSLEEKELYEGSISKLGKHNLQVSQLERQDHIDGSLFASELPQLCGQHIDYRTDDNHRFSFDSPGSLNEPIEVDHSRFSGVFIPEDDQFGFLSPDVPHSCPLPFNSESREWFDNKKVIPGGRHQSDDYRQPPANEAKTISLRGKFENRSNTKDKHPSLCASKSPAILGKDGMDVSQLPGTERSCKHDSDAASNGMIRSCSLKESSDILVWDKATTNCNARRSPLRRMLDPLLKSRASNRRQDSVGELPMHHVRRLSFADKPSQKASNLGHLLKNSSIACKESHVNNDVRKMASSSLVLPNSNRAVQDEKHHETSRIQALLRLAWKNGQPLYTFSMNNNDILAATRKKSICGKTDFECIYTFYHVHEAKKKSSGWMTQGNKSKRQELVSNIVGKMIVSCFQDLRQPRNGPKFCMPVREFVLLGAELRPSSLQTTLSCPDSELAAIVIRSQEELMDSCGSDPTQNARPRNSSNVKVAGKDRDRAESGIVDSNMVAILPSEVHGLSDAGVPPSLIQRWKSGGSCDCGGWDVGCALTILTDKTKENDRSDMIRSCPAVRGYQRAELFVQGGARDSNHVFSMTAFREGLYTVEFDSSIAVLQAFSVCVAILHSRNPRDLHGMRNDLQHVMTQVSPRKQHQQMRMHDGAHASYVPHHPPLSPVGRA